MFSHGKCLDQTDPRDIAISAKGLVKGQWWLISNWCWRFWSTSSQGNTWTLAQNQEQISSDNPSNYFPQERNTGFQSFIALKLNMKGQCDNGYVINPCFLLVSESQGAYLSTATMRGFGAVASSGIKRRAKTWRKLTRLEEGWSLRGDTKIAGDWIFPCFNRKYIHFQKGTLFIAYVSLRRCNILFSDSDTSITLQSFLPGRPTVCPTLEWES